MRTNNTQLTPQNAEMLLRIMQEKAARGVVDVSQRNIVGGRPFRGSLTFGFGEIRGVQILEARSNGGLVMNTPVMPPGFTPQREGDAVAFYEVQDNVVTICYKSFGLPDGQRTFTFA